MRIKTVLVIVASLPVSELRNRRGPALTHNIEVRIFSHDSFAPVSSRLLLVIWICVHSETVKTGIFYPPYSPLYEILEYIWIIKVHIHHRRDEPSAFLDIKVLLRCIRVHIGRECDIGSCVCLELMNPVLERKVLHPPMLSTAMVWHDVHDDTNPLLIRLLHKGPVKLVITESWVDMIVIGSSISMI